MTNQLTLLILVVVISGALCTVEDYVIMSQCAHNKAIYLAAEGTVSVTDISQTQNITIVGRPDFVNNNFKIALYAKETQRYLCFNDHWKLVGMKELQDTCYFNEAIVHGYFVFRSVVESQRRIGFTQRGRAVGPKKTVNDACYMFTKIPTDQFFHQHNHYTSLSAPKSTKTPKPEHSAAHFGRGSGAGSGGGRPKPNRHRNQHRNEDADVGSKSHSKKTKFHGGNRKRQHQQRLQQIRGGGGGGGSGSGSGYGSGASSSDPKNSTYLNSSRQNVELSQYGGHNHTGKHHNHSQPQAHHQTRHHHQTSDARRHHHDAKQKAHHRARVTSTSPEAASSATTTAMPHSSEQTAVTSIKNKLASNTVYGDIKPTSVVQSVTTVAASATTLSHRDVMASTVAHKRKGRRRKPHRKHTFHKSDPHQEGGHGVDSSRGRRVHGHGHATLPSYDDEEYMTTDLTTWINNDMSALGSLGLVKPTSASLPSWATWYPSPSTSVVEDISDYSSSSIASYEKDELAASWETALLASASASPLSPSLDDISKNPLPLMPLPLPTSALSTSYTEHKLEDVISPTTVRTTTTTTATTTNTSTFQESEKWLERQHQHEEVKGTDDSFNTSKVDAANIVEELNITAGDYDNGTYTSTSNSDSFEVSQSLTESVLDAADSTELPVIDNTDDVLLSRAWAPTKSTEPHEPSTKTHASPASDGRVMTDYLYATRAAPLAGNHKLSRHRHSEHGNTGQKHQHNSNNGGQRSHHSKKQTVTSAREAGISTTVSTTTTTSISRHLPASSQSLITDQALKLDALITADKNINGKQSHNTVTDPDTSDAAKPLAPIFSSTAVTAAAASPSSALPSAATSTTTRKTLRKSTQRLLATPFHQLTYVRNEAGDIDIDSLDNISIYPDLLDNDNVNDDEAHKSGSPSGTSRFTMISGYLPTSATATLPESIRIAKIKINRERKRMLRLRNIGGYNA